MLSQISSNSLVASHQDGVKSQSRAPREMELPKRRRRLGQVSCSDRQPLLPPPHTHICKANEHRLAEAEEVKGGEGQGSGQPAAATTAMK